MDYPLPPLHPAIAKVNRRADFVSLMARTGVMLAEEIALMPTNPGIPSKALHIAVVDDHESSRLTICRLLERHGYTTCHFGSVAEFIRSEEKRTIACLISDVRMPEIDGISLQETLQHTNFTFPIIFCTGQELDARLKQALASGVFTLLRKPVDRDALLNSVSAACASGASKKA